MSAGSPGSRRKTKRLKAMNVTKYQIYDAGETDIEALVPVANVEEVASLSFRNMNRLFLLQRIEYTPGDSHARLYFAPHANVVQVLDE